MNVLGCIDYKKPIGRQDDMRTSTYRGHIYMNDTLLASPFNPKFKEIRDYNLNPTVEKTRISEYSDSYVPKYGNPNTLVNPTMVGKKMDFMKNFEDRRLRFVMRKQVPQKSVSGQDYKWHKLPVPDTLPPISVPPAVEITPIVTYRDKPGYGKLLDPGATTSRLDYVHRTPETIMNGIAAHDHITFWNWEAKSIYTKRVFPNCDDKMCDEAIAQDCSKVHNPRSRIRFVPNTGLTTEIRDNYTEPESLESGVVVSKVNRPPLIVPFEQSAKTTENKMYGSGESTEKYV